jgi:hypothetical protein
MKKRITVGLVWSLITVLSGVPAWAWSHAGRYGSASGGGGSWNASSDRGGLRVRRRRVLERQRLPWRQCLGRRLLDRSRRLWRQRDPHRRGGHDGDQQIR